MEAFFLAYFTKGRDINNRQTLVDVVAEAGLNRGNVESVLNGNDRLEAIREAGEQARRFRVESVPFFVVNNEIMVSGAQSPDTFLEAFMQAGGSA